MKKFLNEFKDLHLASGNVMDMAIGVDDRDGVRQDQCQSLVDGRRSCR